MKPELLCMGCMARKGTAAVCPQCGYFDQGPENPQQLPPRTILEGKYLIGRALGQGGFGITYLAWDMSLNKKLAIKEYFPLQISTRAQDRLTVNPIGTKNRHDLEYGLGKFAEEGKALGRFKNHPGVVSMLDFLYANGTAYIVMAYVEGRDLKEYLSQQGGKIPFEAALKILILVMAALEEVHRAGIVHRDISPDNIYVEQNGTVKILDFGATRYALGEQSRSLSVVLKPGYAPEEQYRSRGKQGTWTDIYALGATFYRTITGKVPPESTDRLAEDDLVPPSSMGIAIPAHSEAALLKALA
ncbi:MAG: serine/threonine-protein kinase, partial [Candidatus Sulfotelmatobacter sp.]